MTKWVVLARLKETDMIVDSFGCFKYKRNAAKRRDELGYDKDVEYLIEEVDPSGSYADDEVWDEE